MPASGKKNISKPSQTLRERAEASTYSRLRDLSAISPEEARRLLHELEIHQIELEMQNEELRSAQTEIEQSREHYRNLFDYAPVGYLLFDSNGGILKANLKAEQLLDVERGALANRLFLEFVAPESQRDFHRFWRARKAGDLPQHCELSLQRKDDVRLWVTLEGVEDGESDAWLCTMTDVTERRNAEQKLREYAMKLQHQNEQLTKMNSELEEFAYAASHDLQEPLRTVRIFSELLIDQFCVTQDSEAARFSQYIERAVERMQVLIQDLLTYARVVHTEQEPPRATDLNRSLDEAISVLSLRMNEVGATVVRNPLPAVIGDPHQLSLVFQNLLSNALKYRREGVPPRVEIAAQKSGQEWVISVRDYGIGFAPGQATQIFGLFKRLHARYPGTGLGLAIARRIVERYHGRIWAESAGEGQGAVFFLSLPEALQPEP